MYFLIRYQIMLSTYHYKLLGGYSSYGWNTVVGVWIFLGNIHTPLVDPNDQPSHVVPYYIFTGKINNTFHVKLQITLSVLIYYITMNVSNMFFEITLISCCVVTILALMRFFSFMNSRDVVFQSSLTGKLVPADKAMMFFFSFMVCFNML